MGLVFTCRDCGLSSALFQAHHWNCAAITSQQVITYSDVVAEYDRLRKLLSDERYEIERLRAVVARCMACPHRQCKECELLGGK